MCHIVKVFRVVILPLCLLTLAGCGGQIRSESLRQQGKTPLPPQQLLDLVRGHTLQVNTFGEDIALYFDPSGRVTARDYDDNRDSGRWDVSEGGELCFRFSKWWYGDLRCFSVWQDGPRWLLLRPDGGLAYTATRPAVNPPSLLSMAAEQAGIGTQRASFRKAEEETARRSSFRGAAAQTSSADSDPAFAADASARTAAAAPPLPAMSQTELKSTVRWLARDCPGCNMENADLRAADLVAADLQGANLREANLREANLRRAKLQGANLENAVLEQANLPGADLRQANLRKANLRNANLIRANLTGADLQGADLTGALLEGATGIE